MRKKQYEHFKRLKEHKVPIALDDHGKPITADYIYKKKRRMRPQMSSHPDWELLEKRIEKKVELGILKPVYTMNGEFSPEKQLEEVKKRTDLGYKFMLAEKGLLDYLLTYE